MSDMAMFRQQPTAGSVRARFGKKAREILLRNTERNGIAVNKLCPVIAQDLRSLRRFEHKSLPHISSFDFQSHRRGLLAAEQTFKFGNRFIAWVHPIDRQNGVSPVNARMRRWSIFDSEHDHLRRAL